MTTYFSRKTAIKLVREFCDIDDQISQWPRSNDNSDTLNMHGTASFFIDRLIDRYDLDMTSIDGLRRENYRKTRGLAWRLKRILKAKERSQIRPLRGECY